MTEQKIAHQPAAQTQPEPLAIEGGPKAVEQFQGRREPKIGVAEFLAIAQRFGFSPETLQEIQAVVSDEDLGSGPNLARYATAHPAPPKGELFEQKARDLFGVSYALGVSSGTAALHCAFVAAGVGPGTEVIVPAIGFYATAAMVVQCGGTPIFCDVDDSLGMDPNRIAPLITPRTVALAPTHVMGSVCDMAPILELAQAHQLRVIEDCAQSPGARYRGRPVGSWGDLGCFSISAYKIIGGGEGGLLITDDQRLWERANQLAEAGGLWRPQRFAPPRYAGELFNGVNYRMSELEAAVDGVQLDKLEAIVGRYRRVKAGILAQLHGYAEITPQKRNDPDGEIGYLLRFFPQSHELGGRIVTALRAEGIPCSTRGADAGPDWHLYRDMFPITLHSDPGHTPSTHRSGACPVADDLFNRVVSIPLDQWWSPEDGRKVAHGINKVLSAYCTVDPARTSWLA